MHIFCHLKLVIALAIPALSDEKYYWHNSAGQGLGNLFKLSDVNTLTLKKGY